MYLITLSKVSLHILPIVFYLFLKVRKLSAQNFFFCHHKKVKKKKKKKNPRVNYIMLSDLTTDVLFQGNIQLEKKKLLLKIITFEDVLR